MKFSNTLIKSSLMVALMVFCANIALAQRTVKGKVTDADNGETLIGATVTVVGTTRGAVTDIDGNYAVVVPEGSTQLRFAYTGYAEQILPLGTSNTVDVAMKPGTVLDEVVVVGYGSIKAREVTSSVASVKAEDFNKGNITSAAQLIQGKVAGLSISRAGSDPNGEFSIRLRGLSSVGGGQSPLIVLDGVPGASLSLVDPNDIASIDVLKDGSAAAIYGTRASAGVILITTRKGVAGKTVADYNGFVSIDQVSRRYNTLSAADFIRTNPSATDFTPNDATDTNWFDEITQTGNNNVHNLSLSGGAGTGTFRTSFNYRGNNGILRNSGLDQYNGSLSFTQKVLNNRLTLNGSLFLTARNQDFSFPEAFRYAIVNNPTSPVSTTLARHKRYGGYAEEDLFDYFNPVAIVDQNFRKGKFSQMLGSMLASYQVAPGLTANLTLSQERKTGLYSEYYSKLSKWNAGVDLNGRGGRGAYSEISKVLESTLVYNKALGNNNLTLQGGYSYQDFAYEGVNASSANIQSDVLTNSNLGAFLDTRKGFANIGSYESDNKLIAFFGRARMNFNDIYNVEVGVRREGSTRFGTDNQWGLFPFASASADLAKILDIAGVSALKLRAGYGVTGSQPNQNNLSRLTFTPGQAFYYNGNYVPSYGPNRNPNPDLKWEEKRETNIGLDYAFADYKFTGAIDVYSRKTVDLINEFTVPSPPNLVNRTFQNLGTFTNKGIEATLSINDLLNSENAKYTPSFVFTTYKIKLNELGLPDSVFAGNVGSPGQNDVYYTTLFNGANLGDLWAPVREGVNTDGTIKYADLDGDGVVNAATIEAFNKDQKIVGNGVPKFELGLNNSFSFGRLDVNFFLRGVFGHKLVNEYRVFYENNDPSAVTWNKVDTKYYDEKVTAKNRFDNTHVENASFLKLDNATIGYNFKLNSGAWFNKARVYVSGQNLAVFTKYTGVDPEPRLADGSSQFSFTANPSTNPLVVGIDRRGTYFLARTLSFGVNFGF